MGLRKAFSNRHGCEVWSFDAYTADGRRIRRGGFRTKADAELAYGVFSRRRAFQQAGVLGDEQPDREIEMLMWNAPGGRLPYKPGIVGGISELLVCADLLRQGYDVYRSVTANGECDVIAMRAGFMCRVEVKTGRRTARGETRYKLRANQTGLYDVLAVVFLQECKIDYSPGIAEWFTQARAA